MNPFGGHTGEGDGVIFAFALAKDVVEAAPATGIQISTASVAANTFLSTIPLELTNTEENTDCQPHQKNR